MPAQHHVRHLPLALGEQVAAKMLERRLHPVLEIIAHALVFIALDLATAQQSTLTELTDELAHQWLYGTQQIQLFGAQAFTAETLIEADGNLRVIAGIDDVVAVFRTARLQVIGFVVVTVEE